MSTIDKFKAKLRRSGARPTQYRVTVNFPSAISQVDGETVSVLCKSAVIPPSILEAITIFFRGQPVNFAGERTYDDVTLTFYNEVDFGIHGPFVEWMNLIKEPNTSVGSTDTTEYQTDIKIEQLDRDDSVLATVILKNGFPTNVGEITLSYDEAQTIEEFPVTIKYDYFDITYTSR